MAQALPHHHVGMDENNIHYTSESEDSDDVKTPHVASHSHSKQNASTNHVKLIDKEDSDGQVANGTAQVQADRYGFIGGKEFTDPEQ